MAIEKILVVDDDLLVRNFLSETLRRKQFEVMTAEGGQKALKLLSDHSFDLVITDLRLPDLNGMEILNKAKAINPQTIVIIITAFGSIENSVEAVRSGAFNYLVKPFSADAIEAVLEKAEEHLSLLEENTYLREQVSSGGGRSPKKVIGESETMKKILSDVEQIAKSNAGVFITGESGTGKEVIANVIHETSLRQQRPFIKVNCAAMPETLVESEFFGHEKGAFTGAINKKLGRFELAHSGTLLLDEVTEVPLNLQAKLLRAIQEREFERVGGTKSIKVDVRFISTSNRDVRAAVDQKMFREDLFYRLNVVPIHLPPLRERTEDILPLAEYLLEKLCLDNNRAKKEMTEGAKKVLLTYAWPGNIRELANVIERAIVLDPGPQLTEDFLNLECTCSIRKKERAFISEKNQLPAGEQRLILETLRRYHDNRKEAAEALGITVRTLSSKLNKIREQ